MKAVPLGWRETLGLALQRTLQKDRHQLHQQLLLLLHQQEDKVNISKKSFMKGTVPAPIDEYKGKNIEKKQ